MKNTIHLSSETTISYHYKPERDELTVQLRAATGNVQSESLSDWEHIELQREQASGEVVGFTIRSVQQVLLEQLVRTLADRLQPHFAAPATPATETPTLSDNRDAPVAAAETGEPEPVATAEEEASPPEATPEAPVKKSRSRRRTKAKKEAQPEAVAELEAIVDSNQEDAADSDTKETPAEEMAGEMIEAVATEARADAEGETPPAEPDSETPAPKKSRSRRTKTKKAAESPAPESTPVETVEAVADAPTADTTPPTEEAEAQEPPKKSRSRRRKKAEPAEEPPVVEATEAVAETPEAAPKKTRSRRRKKSEPEATPAPAEEAVPAEPEAVAETKSTPDATETATEGDSATVAEQSDDAVAGDTAASTTEEPAKRKRRKRRKRRTGSTNGNGDSTATAETTTSTADTPATPPKTIPSAPVFRSAYKSAPIEGLDAPDEFLFMGLDPLIGQALHAMGYESPTAIQRRAVPDGMQKRDIVGLAQTGTGKTLAFLLPALNRMLQTPIQEHHPRLLVLTPTRELALQVATEAEYLATHTDIVIVSIYGQEDMKRQIRQLRDGVDVVVATPGRLIDHMQRGTIRLNAVETVVLDEADRMLDMGFLPDVRKILSRVPADRQTMMFSATMPQAVQSLSLDFQRDPVVIEVARQLPPAQIEQKLYPVERHLKIPLLEHLLKEDEGMRSVMVFTETKAEADIVHRKLSELGFDPAIMHGDISQRERERALSKLRNGNVRMLVATNVAARGLDIQDITHVINYEVPQTVDDYVHRIGRTARGEGAEGTAITFASTGDEGMIKRIESALERSLPRVHAEGFNYDVPTPSWAKPSADDIAESLSKPKNLAERFGRMMRRR